MSDTSHYESIVRFLFPSELLEYFDITWVKTTNDQLVVHLKEKNIPPAGYDKDDLLVKDILPATTIQDFPVRGKAMFLSIRRRRWMEKNSGKTISRDWELTARGTKFTKDFGSFLKALDR